MTPIWTILLIALTVLQLLFALYLTLLFHRTRKRFNKKAKPNHQKTVVIIPCKGIDNNFEKNISSFFHLDHPDYMLYFVVEDESDPAYEKLNFMIRNLENPSKAKDIKVLIAGYGQECSQKIHNLIYAYRNIPEKIEILAFADSDVCVNENWLKKLIYPLRRNIIGASTGYRWFIPIENNISTLIATTLNSKIAQLLGNNRFDLAWGGSMAMTVEKFKKLNIEKLWHNALSDDYCLTYAVKKAGLRVEYVSNCLVPSYEKFTFRSLYEFARRQLLITRVYNFKTWLLALFGNIMAFCQLWIIPLTAITACLTSASYCIFLVILALINISAHFYSAFLRKKIVTTMLKEKTDELETAVKTDLSFFWLWPAIMLFFLTSSAIGKKITWRGIKYRIISPTETKIIEIT